MHVCVHTPLHMTCTRAVGRPAHTVGAVLIPPWAQRAGPKAGPGHRGGSFRAGYSRRCDERDWALPSGRHVVTGAAPCAAREGCSPSLAHVQPVCMTWLLWGNQKARVWQETEPSHLQGTPGLRVSSDFSHPFPRVPILLYPPKPGLKSR